MHTVGCEFDDRLDIKSGAAPEASFLVQSAKMVERYVQDEVGNNHVDSAVRSAGRQQAPGSPAGHIDMT